MNWSDRTIREASGVGDYGRIIRLARLDVGTSQKQLGEACGTSQSAISRLENHGTASYDMTLLASAAMHLQIPPWLVGLADHRAARTAPADGTAVERRNFLTAGAAVAALASEAHVAGTGQTAPLRVATAAFRRMEGSTASRLLIEPVLAHLRLTQHLATEASHDSARSRLAAAGSEAASLAGWLSWDMGDLGSARTWYGAGVTAARRSANRLLTAYQLGSLAQLEAQAGTAAHSLSLIRSARKQLGPSQPVIAEAWLSAIEALAHAGGGDAERADTALVAAVQATAQIPAEEPPPWPWVFTFNESKIVACRISCGARLGIPGWVFDSPSAVNGALASGHDKQRALMMLDLASGYLAVGRIDGAFGWGSRALEIGLRYRSGRIVERARALRRAHAPAYPAKVVRDFDSRLHGAYL